MTSPIFYGEPAAVAAAVPGATFVLEGPEARHAVSVKRLAPGEDVDISDGAGLRLIGRVLAAAPARLEVEVLGKVDEPEPAGRFILVQALAKGDRDLQAVESAVELGVDEVIPWQADRSIVRWNADKAAKARAKWQGLAAAAAKQSRRARIPEVAEVAASRTLPGRLAGIGLVLVLHEEADAPLATVLAAAAERYGRGIAVVVGPEGGISPAELQSLREAGAVVVRLGPHVLRSSTAGPAALAVLAYELGRWDA